LHSVSRVRGTRDLVETDASTQQRVIQILGEITQRYGFKKVNIDCLL
jgi:histidyl-tRNA synthetase